MTAKKITDWSKGFVTHVKGVLIGWVWLAGFLGTLFTAFLPDITPITSAKYTAVKFNDKLLFNVDIAKDANYGADLVLYIGNDYVGTLPLTQVGHRVTSATFALPPAAVKSNNLTVTGYWKVNHWTEVIYPQELFYRIKVTIPGGTK